MLIISRVVFRQNDKVYNKSDNCDRKIETEYQILPKVGPILYTKCGTRKCKLIFSSDMICNCNYMTLACVTFLLKQVLYDSPGKTTCWQQLEIMVPELVIG